MTTPFPNGLIGTKAELFYSGRWNDHTEDVRGLGADDGEVEITPRGQPDESSGITTTMVKLAVNNANGKYSPRNVMSDLYGLIGKNTPLRVSADVSPIQSVVDHFNVDSASGWPNAESGHAYTHVGAAATAFIVSGGLGVHRHAAANTTYTTELNEIYATDFDALFIGVRLEDELDEGTATIRFHVRINGGDYLAAELLYFSGTPSNPPVNVGYRIRDNFVTVANSNDTITGDPGHATPVTVRLQVEGQNLRVKAWITADDEPATWDFEVTTTVMLPGSAEVESTLSSGVLNTMPFDVSFDEIDLGMGIVLAVVEVSEWPKRWDTTGNDVWVPITGSGITRRLRQGSRAIRSALYRYMTTSVADLLGYWDFENLTGTVTQVLSSLEGGYPFVLDNSPTTIGPTWSAYTGLDGSGALPTVALKETGGITTFKFGTAPLLPTTRKGAFQSWTVNVFVYTPVINGVTGQSTTLSFTVDVANVSPTSTTVDRVEISIRHEDVAGVDSLDIDVIARSNTGTALITVNGATAFLDQGRMVSITLDGEGASPIARVRVDDAHIDAIASGFASSVGPPLRIKNLQVTSTSTQFSMTLGHLAIAWRSDLLSFTQNDLWTELGNIYDASGGHNGELATDRFQRLCDEEGIRCVITQAEDETGTQCGPQKELNIVDLLLEPVRADDGVMYELRADLGYGFKTRESLYLPATVLTLDYEAHELGTEVPEVTDDDQRTRNRITAKRLHGGESATVTRITGPLSISDPTADPPGAGLYDVDVSPSPNLYSASQVLDYAGLRLHQGTWDEDRWPAITIELHRTPFTGNLPQLLTAVFLEIAEILSIVNTPSWLGPDSVLLQMRAVSVFLSNFNWSLQWTTLPAGPWTSLGVLSSPSLGRLDTHGSELVFSVDDNDTDLIVWTDEPAIPVCDVQWTEDAGELTTHDSDGIDLRLNPPTRGGGLGGEKVNIPIAYIITDTFTRTVSELVGTNADSGQTWVLDDGPSADMLTTGGRLQHHHQAVNDVLWAHVDCGSVDHCVQVDLHFETDTALTSDIECHVILRHVDISNNYRAVVALLAGTSNIALRLAKSVAGSTTNLTSNYTYTTNDSPNPLRVKAMVVGRWLAAKVWRPDLGDEPEWQISLVDAANQMMVGTSVALRSRLESGNTNTLPYDIEWDNLRVFAPKVMPAYYDYFNRTTVGGLGTANSGGAWTIFPGGTSADFSTASPTASILISAANTIRGAFLDDVDLYDVMASFIFSHPVPTGASILTQLLFRGVDVSNYMMVRITVNTSAAITMEFRSVVAGSSALVGSSVSIGWLTFSASVPLCIKVAAVGTTMAAKIWAPSTNNEPKHWQLTATDAINSTGFVGFRFDRNTGNTNASLTPTVQNYRVGNPQRITVDRGENGITREWGIGTDVRLWSPLYLGR